ncbi:MAG: hypothetical protein NUW01_15595 [Gemmatimonadaceae bacterium]|nr:hypothetical protein [Gemmatimonadaceae bacterium]
MSGFWRFLKAGLTPAQPAKPKPKPKSKRKPKPKPKEATKE